jgi:hypothetical protein
LGAALTTFHLAQLYRLEGQLDQAGQWLVQARSRYEAMAGRGDVQRNLSQVDLEAGLVARERGDPDGAIALFRRALDALAGSDDPSAASLVHYNLAFDLIRQDKVKDALHHALASFRLNERSGRRLRDPDERRQFYETGRDAYGLAMHCAARAGDGTVALRVATSARAEALAAFIRAGARLAPNLHDVISEVSLAEADDDRTRANELYDRLEDDPWSQDMIACDRRWSLTKIIQFVWSV